MSGKANSESLSRRERQILDVIYRLGKASAAEIRTSLADPPTYTAVRTHLAILQEKGHVKYESDGTRYIYEPIVPRDEMAKSVMDGVLKTFFGGSIERVVSTLIDNEESEITSEQLDRLAEIIEQARKEGAMSAEFAVRTGLAVVDIAAKSMVVLSVAWLAARLLKRGSAAGRHLVWMGAFCAVLVIPLFTLLAPVRTVPVITLLSWTPPDLNDEPMVLLPAGGSTSTAPKPLQPTPHPVSSEGNWDRWIDAVLIFWLAGLAFVVAQGVWGVLAVRHIARYASNEVRLARSFVDLEALTARVALRRKWGLRVSRTAQPPAAMTWGAVRPFVLLPKDSASWTKERLEAVLLHELAHVRRLDSVSQLIAIAACAFYWFNPIVWLCARAMRAEAETAADDFVIRSGVKPSDYARELLQIAAELGQRRHPFPSIGVPVMKQAKIESRVKAILDPSARRRRGVTLVEALATLGFTTALALSLGSFRSGVATAVAAIPSEPTFPMTSHQAAPSAQEKELREQVRQLKAQQAQMQADLKHAKEQIKLDRAKMLAEIQAIQRSRVHTVAAQDKAALDAQRQALKMRDEARQQQLKIQQQMDLKTKSQVIRQQVELEIQRAGLQVSAAQRRFSDATAAYVLAQKEYELAKKHVEAGIHSAEVVKRAEAALWQAQANFDAARIQLQTHSKN